MSDNTSTLANNLMDMSLEQLEDSMAQLRKRVTITSDVSEFNVVVQGHNFSIMEVDGQVMITAQDTKRRSQYALTGSNHKIIMDDDCLYIAPESVPSTSEIRYTSTAARQYRTKDLVEMQHTSECTPVLEGALRSAGIFKSAVNEVREFRANWRLSFPFADPNLKRKELCLVPQSLAINVRPKLDSNVYRLPRTIVVASTILTINAITTKIKSVMQSLGNDDQYPGLVVPEADHLLAFYAPVSSLEWVEQELQTFSSGASLILICDPESATQFLDCGIEQIWWLNLKAKEQTHRQAVQQILDRVWQCDDRLPTTLTITICFGADDRQEAAMVMTWLQSHMGKDYGNVWGLSDLQKHFS
jgi:hypothetical protein